MSACDKVASICSFWLSLKIITHPLKGVAVGPQCATMLLVRRRCMYLMAAICNRGDCVSLSLQLRACLCLSACLFRCWKQPLTQKQLPSWLEYNSINFLHFTSNNAERSRLSASQAEGTGLGEGSFASVSCRSGSFSQTDVQEPQSVSHACCEMIYTQYAVAEGLRFRSSKTTVL